MRPLVLRDGVALWGEALTERPFETLSIQDGRVARFDGRPDPDAEVVDLEGSFVLPGLIDCHVHFDLAGAPAAYLHWRRPPLTRSLTCLHNGLVALVNGITSVRDLGCVDDLVLGYSRAVRQGLVVGPRVTAAGRPITITGGHFCQYARVADGPTDVRRAVREQIGAGAEVVKVMATGGISTPGDPGASQFTREEIRAAVDEAHKRGRRVAAHAHSQQGILAALEAGVDTIEHAAFADDETLLAIRTAGATLVPTVSALNNIEPGIGIPAETVRKSLEARDLYRDSTRRAIRAGVRIAAGTDAGTALNPIGGLVDELDMYVEYGLPPLEILRTATSHAGQVLGSGVGVLEEGRPADLLVVEDDPREDLGRLRSPQHVISHGIPVDLRWAHQTIQQLVTVVTQDPDTVNGGRP